KLTVTAQAAQAGDGVEEPLRVEPEGYRVDRNVPVVIDLNNATDFEKAVQMMWPSDVVEGSQKARFELVGRVHPFAEVIKLTNYGGNIAKKSKNTMITSAFHQRIVC
ncbi:hypothetical protein GCK32_008329, partial [Trichostrongylus colubriformis]